MKTIQISKLTGTFAENKDVARDIRVNKLVPLLKEGEEVTLDFENVTGATQSFIHALLSDLIRKYDSEIFTKLFFKNCNSSVQEVINIVADYMEATS